MAKKARVPDGPIVPSASETPLVYAMDAAKTRLRPPEFSGDNNAWEACLQKMFVESTDPWVQFRDASREVSELRASFRASGVSLASEQGGQVLAMWILEWEWAQALNEGRHGAAQCYAFALGKQIGRVRSLPFEPVVEAGRKRHRDAQRGNAQAYGSAEEKKTRWDSYQRRFDRIATANPKFTKRRVCLLVRDELSREGVKKVPTWEAISRHVRDPRRPREKK